MRVGINIPSELHRRMEPLKPHFNISGICRDAIEKHVKSYEMAQEAGGDPDVTQAIDRVWEAERQMRDVIEVDWWSLGREDAKAWAAVANLSDWEHLHHRREVISRQGSPAWDVPPPYLGGVKTFNDRFHELHDRMQQEDDSFFDWLYEVHGGIDWNAAERDYMSAWLAYNVSVWDLFLQKRREYTEERRRERSEVRREGTPSILSQDLLDELDAHNPMTSGPGHPGP